MRRLPGAASTSWDILATCGGAGIRFNLSANALGLFRDGVQHGWEPLNNTFSVAGTPSTTFNSLWTGSSGNNSFIIAANNGSSGTFLSSYNTNSGWNTCNGQSSTTAPIALYFRAPGFSP